MMPGALPVWYRTLGTVSVSAISTSESDMFYWLTVMLTQTLGTALGEWTADSMGLGCTVAALVFAGLLAVVVAAHFQTTVHRTVLFGAALILTRPFGAVGGDFLDKPHKAGDLALSRFAASAALPPFMLACIFLFMQRAALKMHQAWSRRVLIYSSHIARIRHAKDKGPVRQRSPWAQAI